jgi:hypothetical protein
MSDLERKVLDAIERRNLKPRPAYVFFARRSVFWGLALLSVCFGGISFAVLLYALSDPLVGGFRSFDEVPFEDVLLGIPALWAVTMPLFIASAYFGLRHTRRGYRWQPALIVALSLSASLAVGGLLHGLGAGSRAHEFLKARLPYYAQLTHIPHAEWSRPDEGYLGGNADRLVDPNTLELTDFRGKRWRVDIAGARVLLDSAIEEEGDVAIRGRRTGDATFRAETIEAFD